MSIGPAEIVIVLILALLVFGPKRLPQMGKSLGRGVREFKKAADTAKTELGLGEVTDGINDVKSDVHRAPQGGHEHVHRPQGERGRQVGHRGARRGRRRGAAGGGSGGRGRPPTAVSRAEPGKPLGVVDSRAGDAGRHAGHGVRGRHPAAGRAAGARRGAAPRRPRLRAGDARGAGRGRRLRRSRGVLSAWRSPPEDRLTLLRTPRRAAQAAVRLPHRRDGRRARRGALQQLHVRGAALSAAPGRQPPGVGHQDHHLQPGRAVHGQPQGVGRRRPHPGGAGPHLRAVGVHGAGVHQRREEVLLPHRVRHHGPVLHGRGARLLPRAAQGPVVPAHASAPASSTCSCAPATTSPSWRSSSSPSAWSSSCRWCWCCSPRSA